jgi:alanine racemase
MNILMADVTDIPDVRIGDEALLLGGVGEGAVPAEELAELSGTINYEFLARLAPTIPRLVV